MQPGTWLAAAQNHLCQMTLYAEKDAAQRKAAEELADRKTALMENAIAWLHSMGVTEVYLESGLHNHAAHEYFMRRGFRKVSEIYKLI